jgi:hypothetical protein
MSRESSVSMSVHGGSDALLECFTYDDTCPILTIRAGGATVSISTTGHRVADESSVTFARNLAEQVTVFAAEIERLHTAQKAAESDAA